MKYKISPQYKKSITEVETWKNDAGETLKHITQWRWGTWYSDEKPDLSEYDPEVGTDPYSLCEELELDSLDDGDSDWEFPDSWIDEKIEKFLEMWDEEWHEAPEQFGFFEEDTEFWISGPIDVEESDVKSE